MRMVGALICLGVLVAGCGGTQELLRPTRSDKLYEAVTARGSQLVSVNGNAFVTKLNPTGTALSYSTYLGGSTGSGGDVGFGIAVDSSGNAYVTGLASSTDFSGHQVHRKVGNG